MVNEKSKILVVGDWFIDENWLMAKCDSYHSYNVGDKHYVSLLKRTDGFIMSLCGAASIMRILNGSPEEETGEKINILKDDYELIGIGAWNPQDTDLLRCLLCPNLDKKMTTTPYLLSGIKQPLRIKKTDVNDDAYECPYIQNSADAKKNECNLKSKIMNLIDEKKKQAKECSSTNRLVRIYEGFGSDQAQLRYRFDWQLPIRDDIKNYSIIENIDGKSVKAVVLVDHGYGVIDKTLVEKLLKISPDSSRWYVRSKLESPNWLAFLKEKQKPIRLVFTDEQLLNYKYCTRVWQHGPTVLGRGLLELFGDLLGLKTYEDLKPVGSNQKIAENAAIYFENETAIAASRMKDKNDAVLINLSKPEGELMPIRVGRSSVFFASLIYWDLINKDLESSMHMACRWALSNAYNWTKDCSKAWLQEEPSELSGPFEHAIYRPYPENHESPPELTYKKSWDEWNASSSTLGIVETENGEQQIQIWRAFGTLKNYIYVGGRKRTKINEMIHSIYHYTKDPKPTYPFNCLFLAEPGWGKSYLAESIAKYFNFEFLSYSIAQMASNKDLIDSLKVIASTQNRTKKRVLVFMDEIDAQIESHYAMGLLLGPIWEGSFKIEGNIYSIEPCIWVFASTKPIEKFLEEAKGRDFLSRINGPIIDLDFFPGRSRNRFHNEKDTEKRKDIMKEAAMIEDNKPLRIELVYLGVNFLNRLFGPISTIDRAVLEMFYNIMPADGIRSLGIFVSQFKNISRGHVSMENVPKVDGKSELSRHIYKISDWPTEDSGEKIKVLLNPPK
jgi:hypothetical protein